jgi:hypothetical protein
MEREGFVLVAEPILRVRRQHAVRAWPGAVTCRRPVVGQRCTAGLDRVDLFDDAGRQVVRREPVVAHLLGRAQRPVHHGDDAGPVGAGTPGGAAEHRVVDAIAVVERVDVDLREKLHRCPASWLVLQRREVPAWAPPA